MTTYPFALPATLRQRLPAPARDGNHYTDVCVAGKWDGILVVDGEGMAIGIYVGHRIEQQPLPFAADKIEDIRQASLWNRFLASLPFDPWGVAVLTILVLSPVALALGRLGSPFFDLFSVVACAVSIRTLYEAGGFPFIRLPVAVCGLWQIAWGLWVIVSKGIHLLHHAS